MLTKKEVLKNNSDHKTIINAVLNRLGGLEYVQDVNSHGMQAGFPGFTYYVDTHAFAMRHRKAIVAMLEQTASDLGEEVVSMVAGFGVFRNSPIDNDDRKELYKYLGGGKCEQSTITNLMAWYAAEEVCRLFDN